MGVGGGVITTFKFLKKYDNEHQKPFRGTHNPHPSCHNCSNTDNAEHNYFPFSNHPFLSHPARAAWLGAMDHALNLFAWDAAELLALVIPYCCLAFPTSRDGYPRVCLRFTTSPVIRMMLVFLGLDVIASLKHT